MSLSLLPLAAPQPSWCPPFSRWPCRAPSAWLLIIAEIAALAALGVAIASLALLIGHGAQTSPLLGAGLFGFSVRLDAVSASMLALVAFIGWIVLRYSARYLDGEARQGEFIGWMAATLATVLLFVISGNLVQLAATWVLTSLFLHKLLLFYPERAAAQRARGRSSSSHASVTWP